jgi:hypothetical protein
MANGLFNLKQVIQAVQQGGWPAQKTPAVEYLVVAGGGGGGYYAGGGGGAGGLLTGIDPVPNGQTLLVTIGNGGASASTPNSGTNGNNSVFGSITATGGGGGGGGNPNGSGLSGGSGGGASRYGGGTVLNGQGIFGQGNNGGNTTATIQGCGGGGAGTIGLSGTGNNAANGGAGIASAISGTVTAYAGGGAGYPSGTGGVGGGGNYGVAGTPNTGGGAGGDGAGPGGSGIVIVSYPDTYAAATSTTGSPTVSTSGSGNINFSGSTYLTYASSSAFAFGSGDFTIEFWIKTTQTTSNATLITREWGGSPYTGGWSIQLNGLSSSAMTIYWADFSTVSTFMVANTTSYRDGNWYHVAWVRNGTSFVLYLDGVSVATATNATAVGVNSNQLTIAQDQTFGSGARAYTGNMTNLRIVKGTAVYTSAFTPPTAPLTAITNTSLLLNSNSGAFLADNSVNSFAPASTTVVPAWNSASPFTVTGYKNRVYTWTSSGSITF